MLPWSGYFIGTTAAILFRLPRADSVAVTVRTGILNSSVAIMLLQVICAG